MRLQVTQNLMTALEEFHFKLLVHVRRIAPRGKEGSKVLTFAQLCYCCIILLIGLISKIYQNFRWLYTYLSLIDQLFSFQQNLF